MLPLLYIVIPCYNEQEVLPVTAPLFLDELKHLMKRELISSQSKILFVNDGSKDNTWSIIQALSRENPHFCGISLSRNRGHQNALLAGLMEVRDLCDISISIDCDGQDDIGAMEQMVEQYHNGCDIVYGVRNNRNTDSVFKRCTAQAFYKLMNGMGVETVYNHADYRLVSKRVLQAFSEYKEVNLFLRGMFPLVGFKSAVVYYSRKERMAGETHYPLSKMLHLAIDGITSLSVKPLRMITVFGFLVAVASFAGALWAFIQYAREVTVSGWASTVCIICFLLGVQMIFMGVLGEYLGKIYLEVKHRPTFFIAERTKNLSEGLYESDTV